MTKTEFEEFRKEFRELRDMTVRLDTKMDGVAAQGGGRALTEIYYWAKFYEGVE